MAEGTRESGSSGCFVGSSLAELGHRDPEVRAVVERFSAQADDDLVTVRAGWSF